jgi:hypothetical protein
MAVGHTILTLIYQVLNSGKPCQEHHQPPLDEPRRQRLIRHHVRRLGKLGVPICSCSCRY